MPSYSKKHITISKLEKKLDAVFSKYIRKRDSIDGFARCFTCRKFAPISKMHAGHYHSRTEKAIRWNEKNVHAQCVSCNLFKEGNKPQYTLRLIDKYGRGILDELETKRVLGKKPDRLELLAMIEEYKQKLNEER
jgi:hypothetical protein